MPEKPSFPPHRVRPAPPEITVEKSWVHAAEGYDVELACIVHGGDVTSDVSDFCARTETYDAI